MFKLTYAHFKSPEFEHSLAKLGAHVFSDEKDTYNIAKIIRRFRRESKDAQGTWENLYKTRVLRDEEGKIVPVDGRAGTFQIKPELRDEWERLLEEYNATEVEFDCHALTPEIIKEARLTPKDIVELEPMLAFKL